jgi:SnoaL-like domain
LEGLFCELLDPAVPAQRLESRLTPDYRQIADGKILDRAGLVDHARALKSVVAEAQVKFEMLLADGERVASLHVVTGRKRDGAAVGVRVYAFFEFQNGRVRRVDEMTRLIEGGEEDRDLGSHV